MTPAYVQASTYTGLVPVQNERERQQAVLSVVTRRRAQLERTGWDVCSRDGTEPPPPGSVLIGAVVCPTERLSDVNLYAYPATESAMVGQAGGAQKRERRRFIIQNKHQDGNWEDIEGEDYEIARTAGDRAVQLAKQPMIYGMTRVLDTQAHIALSTNSAGGRPAP